MPETRAQLVAEAMLKRRLRNMVRESDDLYVDNSLITHMEYQLFLDEKRARGKFYQPDHWRQYRFPKGLATLPVVGVRSSDAIAFCWWLTERVEDAAWTNDTWNFRIPRPDELATDQFTVPEASTAQGYWIGDEKARSCNRFRPLPPLTPVEVFWTWLSIFFYAWTINYFYKLLPRAPDRARARDLARDLERNLYCDLARDLDLDLDLARARAHDLAHALDRDLDFSRDLARDLYMARNLTRALDRDLYRALDLDRALDLALALTRALDLNFSRALDRNLDFSRDRALALNLDFSSDFALTLAHDLDFSRDQIGEKRFVANMRQAATEASSSDELAFSLSLLLLNERRWGRQPAWEGIRIVKERIG